MTHPLQKLFSANIRQDIDVGMSYSKIADKYGVSVGTVGHFCKLHKIRLSWSISNSTGLVGELLFSRQFEFDENFNLATSNSSYDFNSSTFGTVDVKISSIRTSMRVSSVRRFYRWNLVNCKRTTKKTPPKTFVCYGLGQEYNLCFIIPSVEVSEVSYLQFRIPENGLSASKSRLLKFIDWQRSEQMHFLLNG